MTLEIIEGLKTETPLNIEEKYIIKYRENMVNMIRHRHVRYKEDRFKYNDNH